MSITPRYDPDTNISRHRATDPEKCEDMADKYGWTLVRVEQTGDSTLESDCVFEGETEFPPSYYEPEHEREE
ncbi:MAG TPA: hypothetical protein DD379_10450 [Cyanobacteria bacterium UBA11162]|nr:hypothetical protein [Cyanobacteria bacterium UBA11162]